MALRRGIFHPDFYYHHRPTVESAQIASVKIYEPTGEVVNWTPGVGIEDNLYRLVWSGNARVQPNKDWRARPKEIAGEFNASHAVRVQIPIGKNEHGMVTDPATGRVVSYGVDPIFSKDFLVDVEVMPVSGGTSMEGKRLIVRNALISSNAWLYNLLCDIGTKA